MLNYYKSNKTSLNALSCIEFILLKFSGIENETCTILVMPIFIGILVSSGLRLTNTNSRPVVKMIYVGKMI